MTDSSDAAARPAPSRLAGVVGIARFLVADRIGLALLAWLLIAFVVRPVILSAHYDGGGFANDWLRASFAPRQLAQIAGATQWASLAGLILVMALAHVRFAGLDAMQSARGRFAVGSAYGVALTLGYVAFIWTPVTAVSLMLHDAFIFFDAIHRVDHGQIPSSDFPTPLGAAMIYLPWLGSKLSGGYAGAIEISSALVAVFLCLACAQAGARRFPPAVTAILVAAIFLMVVPAMLEGYLVPDSMTIEAGEPTGIGDEYALAMFYNRWGWGAIIAMFAFLTPRPDDRPTPIAEIVTLGLLLVFLFWLKLSYFAVGAGVALLYAFLGPQPWRTLAIGGGVCVGGIALIALVTGNLFAYVSDMLLTSKVSGARFLGIFGLVKDNLLDLLTACSAMIVIGLTRRLTWQDFAIVGLVVFGSLFIINQNAQASGVPTLLVVGAYAIWRVSGDDNRVLRLVAVVALALPALALILERSLGLLGQTMVARREEARPPPAWAGIAAMKGVFAQERESMFDTASSAKQGDQLSSHRAMAMYGRRQILRSGEYMQTLMAGMEDLRPVLEPNESVVVMDFASPLAFLMQVRPAKGYWITFDDGRTISEEVAPEGDVLFQDADHVMMPRMFMEPDTAITLRNLYSDYLDGAYAQRVETTYWVRWSHRKADTLSAFGRDAAVTGQPTQSVAIR